MAKPKKPDKITFSIFKSTLLPLVLLFVLMMPVIILARENDRIRKQELTRAYPTPTPLVTPTPDQGSAPDTNHNTCYRPDGSSFLTTGECSDFMWDKNSNLITSKPTVQKITTQPTTKPVIKALQPTSNSEQSEWGKAVKKEDGSYTMKIGEDKTMSTPQELYQAILAYRQTKGKSGLSWDDKLATYANERAVFICTNGRDGHAGFSDFINNQGGYDKLGFAHLGENMGNIKLSGVHLVEWMYAQSPGHDANQLGDWSHVGVGISGVCNVVIFGGSKM